MDAFFIPFAKAVALLDKKNLLMTFFYWSKIFYFKIKFLYLVQTKSFNFIKKCFCKFF